MESSDDLSGAGVVSPSSAGSSQGPVTTAPERAPQYGRFHGLGRHLGVLGYRWGIMVAWVIVIVVFGFLRPNTFLTSSNFSTIFGSQAVLVMLSMALLIPLTAGEYDLSVAGSMG